MQTSFFNCIQLKNTYNLTTKSNDNCYYEKIGNNEPVKLEDLSFDIPDNWTWIKVKEIFDIRNGFTPLRSEAKYWENGDINWFTIEDIRKQGRLISTTVQKISHTACSKDRAVPANSLLLCCTASIGEYALTKIDLTTNQQFNALTHKNYITKLFNMNFILSIAPTLKKKLTELAGKTTFAFVSTKKLGEIILPLPPLEEQQRIVDKINSFEPLLEKYDKVEKELSKLEKEFPDKLKKSILQYAIEGKLVKQDPNDEPASILLERIKQEKERLVKEGKIKCDKNESYIYQGDDKKYYENLPQGWVICSLGNLATYKKGPFGSSLTKGMFVPDTYPNRIKVYEQKNAIQHDSNLGNYYIPYEKYQEMLGFKVNSLDFIVSCAGTIGEIYKLPNNAQKGIINQALMKVTLINEEISDYFEIIFYDALHKLSAKSKGTAIKNIAPFEILKPATVMVPPIKEQQRILDKLKIINNLIDL